MPILVGAILDIGGAMPILVGAILILAGATPIHAGAIPMLPGAGKVPQQRTAQHLGTCAVEMAQQHAERVLRAGPPT